jgi:hypothetical protein
MPDAPKTTPPSDPCELADWLEEGDHELYEASMANGPSPTSAETIAQAISLKVLADAPDSRGPFVLEVRHDLGPDGFQHIQRTWKQAFDMAGRPAPALLVLGDGMTLRPATEEEAHANS